MKDVALMQLHVGVLFVHDANHDLVRVNEPNGAPAPRFFLGRTRDGVICRFRHDVDARTRQALRAACDEQMARKRSIDLLEDPLPYQHILARVAPVEKTWFGPAYCLPRDLPVTARTIAITAANASVLQPLLESWDPDVPLCQPMMALAVDGRAVALCCSGRRTEEAHEAAVETVTPYRNRGYGSQVVRSWANAVYAAGRVPLYSTSWQNTASQALMRKLELSPFGVDLHVT
jgi:hypothetical protein